MRQVLVILSESDKYSFQEYFEMAGTDTLNQTKCLEIIMELKMPTIHIIEAPKHLPLKKGGSLTSH